MSKNARNPLEPRGINPTQRDVGRNVVYRTAPNYEAEEGVITSFNDQCVFVRYGSAANSQATSREALDWLFGTGFRKGEPKRLQRWNLRATKSKEIRK